LPGYRNGKTGEKGTGRGGTLVRSMINWAGGGPRQEPCQRETATGLSRRRQRENTIGDGRRRKRFTKYRGGRVQKLGRREKENAGLRGKSQVEGDRLFAKAMKASRSNTEGKQGASVRISGKPVLPSFNVPLTEGKDSACLKKPGIGRRGW